MSKWYNQLKALLQHNLEIQSKIERLSSVQTIPEKDISAIFTVISSLSADKEENNSEKMGRIGFRKDWCSQVDSGEQPLHANQLR